MSRVAVSMIVQILIHVYQEVQLLGLGNFILDYFGKIAIIVFSYYIIYIPLESTYGTYPFSCVL